MNPRASDEVWLRQFVRSVRWRFAKTYVESYPHEYTLDEWCDDADFARAIACIEAHGVEESFWSARRKYLYIDERMYWHMGDAASEDENERPGLINRSWVDLRRHREDALSLGYGGEALDRLVDHWQDLLGRARRRPDVLQRRLRGERDDEDR